MQNPYAAPTAEPLSVSGGFESFEIPGVAGRLQYEPPGMFRGSRLFVDGQPAKRNLWGRISLPGADGSTVYARIAEGLAGPALRIGRTSYPIGPRIPVLLGVLALLPIGLVAAGGALGGFLGAAAWIINRRIALSDRSVGMRIALMLGVLLAAVTIVLGVVLLFIGLPGTR